MAQNTLLKKDGEVRAAVNSVARAFVETCKMSLTSYNVRAVLKISGGSN